MRQVEELNTAIDVLARKYLSNGDGGVDSSTPPVVRRQAATSTQEAIAQVVLSSEREWTGPELLAAIQERGWSTPAGNPIDAIRAAVVRLSNAGRIERPRAGYYRRPAMKAADSPPEAPDGLSALPAPLLEGVSLDRLSAATS